MSERYTIPQLVFQALCGFPIYSDAGFILAEERVYNTRWACDRCEHAWMPDKNTIKMKWQFIVDDGINKSYRQDYLYASTYCPKCGVKMNLRLATMDIHRPLF